MNKKGLISIDFDKSTNWILFLAGAGVGFFGFSLIFALFDYITQLISGWAETKMAVYLTKAQENITGAAIFIVGGIVAVKLFATLLTFMFGFVLGVGAKFILYNHLGVIPQPDIGNYFGYDIMEGIDGNVTNTTLNETLNQTVNQTVNQTA